VAQTERIKRRPVPEDNAERFMLIVWSLVDAFGIDHIPNVHHYVELLGQSVERHIFESTYGGSKKKRMTTSQKRFIAVFKARYLEMTDLEYTKKMTHVDGKLVKQAIELLTESCFEPDDYLTWLFEHYLPDNPKFCPPTMRQICSSFFLHKFLYENKELSAEKRQEEVRRNEALDLVNRARVLMRTSEDDERKKIEDLLKRYREEDIMTDEFRTAIERFEAKGKR